MPKMVPLAGSKRIAMLGAKVVGLPDQSERIIVSVITRRRDEDGFRQIRQARRRMGRAGFRAAYGADTADLEAIAAYAQSCRVEVVEIRPTERRIILAGSISDLSGAFGASLSLLEHSGVRYRRQVGPLLIPEHLQSIIPSVVEFDNRSALRPRFRIAARNVTMG